VLVCGEAGIGKWRLVRERMRIPRLLWLDLRGSPFQRPSALQPVLDLVQRALGIGAGDDAPALLARLRRARLTPARSEPALRALLQVPDAEGRPARTAALSPEGQRRRWLEDLVGTLLELARRRPVALVCEDLQGSIPRPSSSSRVACTAPGSR
jgi:predicted ATPase